MSVLGVIIFQCIHAMQHKCSCRDVNLISGKETTENDGASVGVATEADIHTPTHQTAAISPKKAKLSTSPNKVPFKETQHYTIITD